MITALIISKNQSNNLAAMVQSMRAQLPSIKRLFVLDRCTDDSASVLSELNERCIEKHTGNGFDAGATRDFGLNYINDGDDVLFLDGDRTPFNLSIDLLSFAVKNYDSTLLKADVDYRKWFTESFTLNPKISAIANEFATCGCLLRRCAIDAIRNQQNGRLFNPAFDGNWGFEDYYVGHLIYRNNFSCAGFPIASYVAGGVGIDNNVPYKMLGSSINKPKYYALIVTKSINF